MNDLQRAAEERSYKQNRVPSVQQYKVNCVYRSHLICQCNENKQHPFAEFINKTSRSSCCAEYCCLVSVEYYTFIQSINKNTDINKSERGFVPLS